MTATTAGSVSAPLAHPADRPAGFGRLMQSEWTKIKSVRSTVWSFAALIVLTWGFTALSVGFGAAAWDDTAPADKATIVADPAAVILGSGVLLGQLAMCVLGVMVIASEYSTGMIRASVLAVPKRVPMLAAKVAVFGLLALGIGLIVSFGSFFIGQPFFRDIAPVSLGDPGVLRAVVGAGLYLAMIGIFALAVGAIVRHTAAGITGVIGLVLVLSPLARLLPGSFGDHLHAYLPSEAGRLIAQASQASGDLLTPWQGFGVFTLWTVILLVVAAVLLKRRDA